MLVENEERCQFLMDQYLIMSEEKKPANNAGKTKTGKA